MVVVKIHPQRDTNQFYIAVPNAASKREILEAIALDTWPIYTANPDKNHCRERERLRVTAQAELQRQKGNIALHYL